MKEYSKNSKKTTDAEIQKLKESIYELGDISGIVYDVNSDEIICGNQRSSIININKCEIKPIKEFKKADKFGTLLYGYVDFNGKRFPFRKVEWNEVQRQKANLCANLMYSSYDNFELARNFSEEVLKDAGFKSHEINLVFGGIDFERDIKENFKPTVNSVTVKFGDETKMIEKKKYEAWEERILFECDYNETEVEKKLKSIIENGINSY